MLKKLINMYQYLVTFGGLFKSPLLLLCRLYFGWIFFQAGVNKFHDIAQFAQVLKSYHLIFPTAQAYIAATTELVGGLCLMFGFATRLVAIPLIIVMITAYSTAHVDALKALFHDPSNFVSQTAFNPLLTSFMLLAFGPGRFSVDYLLEKWVFKR